MTTTTDIATAAATLGRKGGTAKTAAKTSAARANGNAGGRPRRPMFEVEVYDNEGEKFASVRHLASGCGADFYKSGEKQEWQDNNGLFSNCSDYIVKLAGNAANRVLR